MELIDQIAKDVITQNGLQGYKRFAMKNLAEKGGNIKK
jgi:hypothetical protein